jgi:hypothetical protein
MGWMDIARIIEPDPETSFGGRLANDFFTSSGLGRKTKKFDFGSTEEPITSMTETWQPPTSRRNRLSEEDFAPGPAMTDYLKHIQNVPKREEYSPSIWHRLVGGLSGGVEGGTRGAAAGIKTASEVLDMPYRRAREDYELKGSGLEAAAKLEELTQRNKTAYKKELLQQDEADKDREVKWANSEINRIKAEQAARRITLEEEIKRATNETSRQRLQGQLDKWLRDSDNELAKLELLKQDVGTRQFAAQTGRMNAVTNQGGLAVRQQEADTSSRKTDAYTGYMGRLGQLKPPTAASIGITRRIIEEEIKNEYPDILDRQGAVRPDKSRQFEQEIQRRLRTRLTNMGGMGGGNEPEENPYEPVP